MLRLRAEQPLAPRDQISSTCEFVIAFLTRYVIWCARTRRFDRLRNALDLSIEVDRNAKRTRSGQADGVPGSGGNQARDDRSGRTCDARTRGRVTLA
jgi:hypothetical protein